MAVDTVPPPVTSELPDPDRPPVSAKSAVGLSLLACAVALVFIFFAHNARRGAQSRIANPAVHGAPRPVTPLFGWTHWLGLEQVSTIVAMVVVVTVFVAMWRRHPKHPILLMAICCTAIVWQDPIMNWAPYAVYNPQLWHLPVTWPLVSLSPTVEPFVVIGYVMFYLVPFFPARKILRALQRRRPFDSFVWRHPLISLGLLIFVIGFVFDAILEIGLIRTGMYIYSQVIPFGSIFAGKAYQFPLLWESSLVTTVMIPAGVLLYRHESGPTVAEKLARRLRGLRVRPVLGTFIVMFLVMNGAYLFLYGGGFAVVRASGAATSVACPFPYPEAKAYDPQGLYAKAGQPGPYSAGIWDRWESGQSGRPPTATSSTGPCAADPEGAVRG